MPEILIVEDSATQAEQLRTVLEDAGYAVTVARDGQQAFDSFANASFDAVISDIVMPGLSGYELCRKIKATERGMCVPVVLLSTLNESMDIIRGLECGADNFLTKPCPPDLLLARLSSILESKAIRAGRRASLGIEILFLGQRFTIDSAKEQILDLLISTFEDTVRANQELQRQRANLAESKAQLEEYSATLEEKVNERTRDLAASHEEIQAEIVVRRRTQEELSNARAFLNLIIETIPVIVVVKDAQTLKIVLVNAMAEKAFGRSRDEVIGKTDHDLLPQEIADQFLARDAETLRSGKPVVTLEQIVRRPNQTEAYLRIRQSTVPDENGDPKYLVTVSEDVTALRQIEQQLRQTQKMEAIGQLTGGIAHDFNNLLGVILGNLDLLSAQIDANSECAELAEEAITASRRGAELTQRMLAFARKQPLQPRAFDMNEIVTGMKTLLGRTLLASIELLVVPAEGLWPVVADPSQIEDVILNLAVNARDAMPNGGHLVIETAAVGLDEAYAAHHADVTPGDYVMLAVTDSGTGMPQSVIERAFEPFFTTKEIGRGTGLGLSMVYGFAKQSGGHLKIYSEVGHGTTVKLYLPRATDPAEARAGESNDTAPVPVGSETILVVEDNEALRRTTVRMLTQLGYTVLEAEAGQAALDVLHEANGVDLILTDIVMPKGMSGYDLAEMASEIWPHIRILFMSGYSEHFLNKLNVRESRIHLITKPFRKQDLARKLRSILDGVPT